MRLNQWYEKALLHGNGTRINDPLENEHTYTTSISETHKMPCSQTPPRGGLTGPFLS